jgi:hypothetical protein
LEHLDLRTGRFHPLRLLIIARTAPQAPYRASGLVQWHKADIRCDAQKMVAIAGAADMTRGADLAAGLSGGSGNSEHPSNVDVDVISPQWGPYF